MPPPTEMTPSRFRAFVITMLLLPLQLAIGAAVHAEPLAYVIGNLANNRQRREPGSQRSLSGQPRYSRGRRHRPGDITQLQPRLAGRLRLPGGDRDRPLTGRLVAISDNEGDAVLRSIRAPRRLRPRPASGGRRRSRSIIGFGLAVDEAGIYYLSSNGRLSTLVPDTGAATVIFQGVSGPNTTDGLADASATHLWALPDIFFRRPQSRPRRQARPVDPHRHRHALTANPKPRRDSIWLPMEHSGASTLEGTCGPSIRRRLYKATSTDDSAGDESVCVRGPEHRDPARRDPRAGDGNPWLSGMPGGSGRQRE